MHLRELQHSTAVRAGPHYLRHRHAQFFDANIQYTLADSAVTLLSAILLTFLSAVDCRPKNIAISTNCLALTKASGLAQNFSIPGANSRHFIPFGMFNPSLQVPASE